MNSDRKGKIRDVPCDVCGGERFTPLFEKESSRGEIYQVVQCRSCGLVQVNPQPDVDAVRPYYESGYFEKRTDRGYDNYFSSALKQQINHVYELNLNDLGFSDYERDIIWNSYSINKENQPKSLDAGCAAGYFVEYMREKGWKSEGIEISESAARFGIDELSLDIIVDDFLSCKQLETGNYQLVTMWASIEHMHSPMAVLRRGYELLAPGGRMILSTCRYGLLAQLRQKDWRYMNVPEHLYFFRMNGFRSAARKVGFDVVKAISYGSGFTTKKDSGLWYKLAKRIADPLVKALNQGDMMAIHLRKPE